MRRPIALSLVTAFVLSLIAPAAPAGAQAFRGVEFPQGAASFADAVVAYAPDLRVPLRSDVKNPAEALGVPNNLDGIPAEYVSLGNGGSLTLRFVDNALTGSGNANKDVWVFEIGVAVEDTAVAISRDGVAWIEVGTVAGSTAGVDIDPFLPDPAEKYSYVRLIDVAAADFDTGNTAGADIDAVGAISTVTRPADTAAPVVTVPAGVTAEATGPGGAAVPFDASALDAVDGAIAPACTPAPGSTFPLGVTTVTCAATDDAGNTGRAGFKVTVVDTTGPAVTVPADITAEATSADGAAVAFDAASASDLVDGTRTALCDAESGATFPLGETPVTCVAADSRGNEGNAGFTVTVQDTTAPAVTPPADITAEATGPGGATVGYSGQAAYDLVDGALIPTCSPASGSTFPLGETTVTCSAADAAGNTGSARFTVAVGDTTAPVLALPAAVTAEATGPGGATVAFVASASDLVDGAVPVSCVPASGSTFPLGETAVECSAADANGNAAASDFTVTVEDTTAPELDLPQDIVAEATGPGGAAVSFAVSASDLVDGTLPVGCDHASGATFPLGPTTVTCAATDDAGNTETGSFTIRVQDTTPPALDLPAAVVAEATGPGGAAVSYSASAEDIVDGDVAVACAPASGSTFALGATAVACSATDGAGNAATGGFDLTVRDTTPPSLAVADVVADATSPAGAVVAYAASASDAVDGALTPLCGPASGSTFPLGATAVSCTATDSAGNQGGASFVVTVVAPTYGVCPLFDQSKSVKGGAVKVIRVQLCDAAGNNLSSPDIVLHAVGLVHVDGTPSAQVEDPGQANPDHDFRYDGGTYVFNLDTRGLSSGTWKLQFTIDGYGPYAVTFDVK